MSSYICEELIDEIFERLPPKSLIRFRSLSKSWYSRIGSSEFVRMHTLRSLKNASRKILMRQYPFVYGQKNLYALYSKDQFPLYHRAGDIDKPSLEFSSRYHHHFVNSCNGIICLLHFNDISIWNPSISRKLTLHNLFFYSEKYSLAFGFGYDPINDDYKIVRISYTVDEGPTEYIFLYSMKTRFWCRIVVTSTPFNHIMPRACFVNGALHWVVTTSSDSDRRYIKTFNLSTHVFNNIRLPERCKRASGPTTINGSLAVISSDETHNHIWVMKKYNDVASWYVLFKVKHNSAEGEVQSVLQLSTNNYFLINRMFAGIKVYNPSTQVVFRLLKDGKFHFSEMEMCLESLELLDR